MFGKYTPQITSCTAGAFKKKNAGLRSSWPVSLVTGGAYTHAMRIQIIAFNKYIVNVCLQHHQKHSHALTFVDNICFDCKKLFLRLPGLRSSWPVSLVRGGAYTHAMRIQIIRLRGGLVRVLGQVNIDGGGVGGYILNKYIYFFEVVVVGLRACLISRLFFVANVCCCYFVANF